MPPEPAVINRWIAESATVNTRRGASTWFEAIKNGWSHCAFKEEIISGGSAEIDGRGDKGDAAEGIAFATSARSSKRHLSAESLIADPFFASWDIVTKSDSIARNR